VNRRNSSQNEVTYTGSRDQGRVFADFTEGRNSVTERSGVDFNDYQIRSDKTLLD
jgi:hypothetical protein